VENCLSEGEIFLSTTLHDGCQKVEQIDDVRMVFLLAAKRSEVVATLSQRCHRCDKHRRLAENGADPVVALVCQKMAEQIRGCVDMERRMAVVVVEAGEAGMPADGRRRSLCR